MLPLFSLSFSLVFKHIVLDENVNRNVCLHNAFVDSIIAALVAATFFPALQRFKKVNDGSQPKCMIEESVPSLCCFVHILMKLNLKYQLCSSISPYNIFRCKVCNCSSSLYLSNVILMIQRETIAHYQAKNYKREYLNGNHLK